MTEISEASRGPLTGLKVVEFVSIGPGPYCAMLLSDLGAEVLRVDRPGGNGWPNPILDRGRAVLELDIRSEAGRKTCIEAADHADVIIEGLRPGVMERLGLGPDVLLQRNPRLVYGRMTGWGQDGPLSQAAGHDINYIALTGALAAIGLKGQPAIPPLNLVGDFGGGALFLAMGILAALWERERSGKGQVVDAAIIDGVASMISMFAGLPKGPMSNVERGENLLGGGAHFYRCYTCSDGRDIAIGPIEPHFFAVLLEKLGLPDEWRARQYEAATWEQQGQVLEALFATRSRAEWTELLEGTDACFSPVLTLAEAPGHPHMQARQAFFTKEAVTHPAPAPRFSRTPGKVGAGGCGDEVLMRWKLQQSVE